MPLMYISSICFYKKNNAYSKFSINSAAKSSALKQSLVSSTNTIITHTYIYIHTHTLVFIFRVGMAPLCPTVGLSLFRELTLCIRIELLLSTKLRVS